MAAILSTSLDGPVVNIAHSGEDTVKVAKLGGVTVRALGVISGFAFGCAANPVAVGGGPIELSALGPWHGAPVVGELLKLSRRSVGADQVEGFQEVIGIGGPALREARRALSLFT
jgi:hypothetical protein